MLRWKEFSAWITIEGVTAIEYDIEVSEEDKTVTCWIASEVGKKFSVNWKNASYLSDTSGKVKMDGVSCGGKFIRRKNVPATIEMQGVDVDEGIIRPFIFSSLDLTDDDALLTSNSESLLQSLGLIELRIVPIKASNQILALKPHALPHERSKKAVTQQITLGETINLPKIARTYRTHRIGADIVAFRFRYRPIDILRANGIAPQLKRKLEVEAEPVPTSDDDEDAVVQELKSLRERMSVLEATMSSKKKKKAAIKREGDVAMGSKPKKKFKAEGSRLFTPGEVIDLT